MAGGGAPAAEAPSGNKKNVFGEDVPGNVTLNLTALMDILSNLLFFLLASFGATIVMAINVNVPVQSADKSDVADTKQTVTLNVQVKKASLEIAASGAAQTNDELLALNKSIPYDAAKPEFDALSEYLVGVKEKYPKSDTIIMTPEAGVNYEIMVRVMDAAREKELKSLGVRRTVRLFPTVVVSTVVK
jgi:biopolymer transport protein ExbD